MPANPATENRNTISKLEKIFFTTNVRQNKLSGETQTPNLTAEKSRSAT